MPDVGAAAAVAGGREKTPADRHRALLPAAGDRARDGLSAKSWSKRRSRVSWASTCGGSACGICSPSTRRVGRYTSPVERSNDRCVELTRFTDLAGAFELGERLPHVLTSASGRGRRRGRAEDVEAAVERGVRDRRKHRGALVPSASGRRRGRLLHGPAHAESRADVHRARRRGRRHSEHDAGQYAIEGDLAALRYALVPGVSGDDGGGNGLGSSARGHRDAAGRGDDRSRAAAALLRVRARGRARTRNTRAHGRRRGCRSA